MPAYAQWTAFYTMLRKDMVRIFRIWVQTFIPSVITSALYFLIFGTVLGSRIGQMQGVDYMSFVVPGLVMLAIVTNAYANSSFTFFQSKFFARSIDEMLVSPMPPWLIIAGFVAGGVIRGVLVGALVLMSSSHFIHFSRFGMMRPGLSCTECQPTLVRFRSFFSMTTTSPAPAMSVAAVRDATSVRIGAANVPMAS